MERGRKTKIITIVALVVAIVTMSLGFAVFSNVLTISSSATVKPNAEDFVINIYGLDREISYNDISIYEPSAYLSYMTSKTTSVPILYHAFDATSAIIDNRNFTISNLNATFSNHQQAVLYLFLIKNEGKKDVYINAASFAKLISQTYSRSCVASEGTSQELVDQVCEFIKIIGVGVLPNGDELGEDHFVNGSYKLVPNDYIISMFGIVYAYSDSELVADGEFAVEFEDIQFEFSSVDNSQSN